MYVFLKIKNTLYWTDNLFLISDFSDMENVGSDYESEMSEDEGKNQIKPDKKERIVSENDLNKVFSDDEVSHISGDSEDGFDLESGKETPEDCKTKEKPDIWEDIYGRKRDKDGNIIKVSAFYI